MPVPNIFARETRIESAKVNQNFDYLDGRVTTLESSPGSGGFELNPKDFGAIGDGNTHPLSSVYATLVLAQVTYPFATALTQEIDYCAFKAMCLEALGAEGAEHADTNAKLNSPMKIPAGSYLFGDDTLTIRNTSGMKMTGSGKRATKIYGNNTVIAFDGLWYSEMSDMSIICLTNTATVAFDIDGNVPGHPYATRGVQGNTFRNMLFDGGMSDYAITMCRQGISSGQGSENLFVNCHVERANLAGYYQISFNALNNMFLGGNFQSYNKDGIHLESGHCHVFDVGFQSTVGYTQIINDGWDVSAQGSGVADKILVQACRTESLRFCKALGSTPIELRSITHNPSLYIWTALAAVALNVATIKMTPSGLYKLFRVTTAGVSAGAEPVWPDSGAIADGTAVWTQTDYSYIEIESGNVDITSCISPYDGPIINRTNFSEVEVAADYTLKPQDRYILVDCTTGARTITIPSENNEEATPIEKEIIIKKYDGGPNGITVNVTGAGTVDFAAGSADIPGGSRGFVRLKRLGGGAFTRRWFIVGQSL